MRVIKDNNKTDKKEKKRYEEPGIVYEKEIEVLAAVCNSVWTGGGCRTVSGGCSTIRM